MRKIFYTLTYYLLINSFISTSPLLSMTGNPDENPHALTLRKSTSTGSFEEKEEDTGGIFSSLYESLTGVCNSVISFFEKEKDQSLLGKLTDRAFSPRELEDHFFSFFNQNDVLNITRISSQYACMRPQLWTMVPLNLCKNKCLTEAHARKFFKLTSLTSLSLDLRKSELNVRCLTSLSNLNTLKLFQAHLSNETLKIFSSFTKLKSLGLCKSRFNEISNLNNLTNLTHLKLWGSEIISDGSHFPLLPSLILWTNLTSLSLRHTNTQDLSPLDKCTNLTRLNLSSNDIKDLSTLNNLTNLTHLKLEYVRGSQNLVNLPNLTVLRITNGPSDLSDFTNLTSLRLSRLETDERELRDLSKLTKLTSLNLSLNQISDSTLQDLLPLSKLTWLRCSCVRMGQNSLEWLSSLTTLESLQLVSTYDIANISPLNNLTNLTYLSFDDKNIDTSALNKLTNLRPLVLPSM